jgi:hypothetical protein
MVIFPRPCFHYRKLSGGNINSRITPSSYTIFFPFLQYPCFYPLFPNLPEQLRIPELLVVFFRKFYQFAVFSIGKTFSVNMKKILTAAFLVVLLLGLALAGYTWYRFRDRHPGYALDLTLRTPNPARLKAGFGKVDITPTGYDTWHDHNGDARFNPADGDYYNDLNGNGRFDAVWLAGFHQNRPASGTNDPLWARAMVIDDGQHRLALCVLDLISFGNDEVIHARKRLPAGLGIDYLIVASTHVHASPDMMGMYGPDEFTRGTDPQYFEQVYQGIVASVSEAVDHLTPCYLRLGIAPDQALPMVGDTRDPQVFDGAMKLMQVMSLADSSTLGTLMNWGNHPETLWAENTLLTSDFPHYFRHYLEDGIVYQDTLREPGLGGTAIFLNGALGGLMTTHPSVPITHPYSGEVLLDATVAKIDAQGMALAKIALEVLRGPEVVEVGETRLSLRAKTIALRLDNPLFRLAAWTGIFDRGFMAWGKIRSEVAAWSLGPASFVHIPGELYPEILHGGIEAPEGADFAIPPVEVPPIAEKMPGSFRFFSGMANDMIGYIVPKSQWDELPPFTYGRQERPYGEINSLGPETAPTLHQAVMEILTELNP